MGIRGVTGDKGQGQWSQRTEAMTPQGPGPSSRCPLEEGLEGADPRPAPLLPGESSQRLKTTDRRLHPTFDNTFPLFTNIFTPHNK